MPISDTTAGANHMVNVVSDLLRLPAVVRHTGLSRSTIYRLMAARDFPASVKLAWIPGRAGDRADPLRGRCEPPRQRSVAGAEGGAAGQARCYAALKPKRIVPGCGLVTTLAIAQSNSQAYLLALRAHMIKAVGDGIDVSAAVKSFDAGTFMPPLSAAELMPGNASRTDLEIEREQSPTKRQS